MTNLTPDVPPPSITNPNPTQSFVTSAVLWAAGVAVSWAVSKGYVASGDQATIVGDLGAILLAGLAGAVAWWKAHQSTQKALIKAVNEADNGVMVVAETERVPQVNGPLK